MSEELVYLVSIPALRNSVVKIRDDNDDVVILYWNSRTAVEKFLVDFNIPGVVVSMTWDVLLEASASIEGCLLKEAQSVDLSRYEFSYYYNDDDIEYYRDFLEKSYEATVNVEVERPVANVEVRVDISVSDFFKAVGLIALSWTASCSTIALVLFVFNMF